MPEPTPIDDQRDEHTGRPLVGFSLRGLDPDPDDAPPAPLFEDAADA